VADSTLILGLAGIGGTVSVAAIGSATTAYLQVRREGQEKRERNQARGEQRRRAVRLVALEFQSAAANLGACLEGGRWWPVADVPRLEAWKEHQAAVSSEEALDFSRIAKAVETLGILVRARTDLDANHPDEKWWELPFAGWEALFDECKRSLEAAVSSLYSLCGEHLPEVRAGKSSTGGG